MNPQALASTRSQLGTMLQQRLHACIVCWRLSDLEKSPAAQRNWYPQKKLAWQWKFTIFLYRGIHLTSNGCFFDCHVFFGGGVLTYVAIITYLVGIKASRWCFVVPGALVSLSWWNIDAHPKEVAVDEHTKQKLVLSCHFNRKSYHQSLFGYLYGIPKANAPCATEDLLLLLW